MTFTVKYRTQEGKLGSMELDVADRNALWPELARQGIKAISISEGCSHGRHANAVSSRFDGTRHQVSTLVFRAALAGFLAVVLVGGVIWFLNSHSPEEEMVRQETSKANEVEKERNAAPSVPVPKVETRAEKIGKVKVELNEMVRAFIKKADTNHVVKIGPAPLDPDDPDNALLTQTMTEVAMLVGIVPGEPMPPVPFTFMLEDEELKQAEKDGKRVVSLDGGNKRFQEELAQWKITIKDTDSDSRAAKKQELLQSQLDLLNGIDDGISVNDSIRAAYEFRQQAYKTRQGLMSALSEIHEVDPDVEITKGLIDKANEKLTGEGIKTISYEEVIPDYEEETNEEKS